MFFFMRYSWFSERTTSMDLSNFELIDNESNTGSSVKDQRNDLVLSDGYCGSKSGMVPVTIGQPTIKISKILVGGKE